MTHAHASRSLLAALATAFAFGAQANDRNTTPAANEIIVTARTVILGANHTARRNVVYYGDKLNDYGRRINRHSATIETPQGRYQAEIPCADAPALVAMTVNSDRAARLAEYRARARHDHVQIMNAPDSPRKIAPVLVITTSDRDGPVDPHDAHERAYTALALMRMDLRDDEYRRAAALCQERENHPAPTR